MNVTTVRTRSRRAGVRLAALAGAALFTLTGCFQAHVGVTLNDDESGEFRVRSLINREQISELEGLFGGMTEGLGTTAAPVDPCEEMLAEDMSAEALPEGAVVEPIDDGEWCGALVTIPFADLAEFEQLAAQFSESSADEESTDLGIPSIEKTGAGYRFSVTGIEMSDDTSEDTEGMEGMDELAEMLEAFTGDLQVRYDVRLPGNPVDHNADAVEGNSFQWTLEWGDERTELFAETGAGEPDGSADTGEISLMPTGAEAGGDDAATGDQPATGGAATDDDDDGSSLTWLWILLGVVVVGGAIGAFVIMRNRGKTTAATGPTAPPAPPTQPQVGSPSAGWDPPHEP